jgi:hypothetical protein
LLRILWGSTPLELAQEQTILRLHAQLADLTEKYHQTQQEAAKARQADYDGFMRVLRPQVAAAPSYEPPADEWPGQREDTAPEYPKEPIWATKDVKTEGQDVDDVHAVPV